MWTRELGGTEMQIPPISPGSWAVCGPGFRCRPPESGEPGGVSSVPTRAFEGRHALLVFVLLSCILHAGCGPRSASNESPARGSGVEATVYRVADGDTVSVEPGIGGEDSVRLIGVDAPEVTDDQPYAAEAASFAEDRLDGRRVRLEFDAEERDDYGRVLAYVYLPDSSMFNETLLREGLAQVATFPPNTRYVSRFEGAQEEAREAGRGIWDLPTGESCRLRDRGNGIGGC